VGEFLRALRRRQKTEGEQHHRALVRVATPHLRRPTSWKGSVSRSLRTSCDGAWTGGSKGGCSAGIVRSPATLPQSPTLFSSQQAFYGHRLVPVDGSLGATTDETWVNGHCGSTGSNRPPRDALGPRRTQHPPLYALLRRCHAGCRTPHCRREDARHAFAHWWKRPSLPSFSPCSERRWRSRNAM
jgi:hypothetical protein